MNFLISTQSITLEGTKDGAEIKVDGENIVNTDVSQGDVNQTTIAVEETGAEANTQTSTGGILGTAPILLMWLALGIIFYFATIRPNKKREKKLIEDRNAIEVGDTIVTNSGLYGKVVDIGTNVFIVEFGTNKGVKIPVNKAEVLRKAEPDLSKGEPVSSDKK